MYPSFFDELMKLAEEETKKTDVSPSEKVNPVVKALVKARPYASGAAAGGIPAAFFARTMFPGGETEAAKRLGRIAPMAALGVGAGLGVANAAIKRWAAKHPESGLEPDPRHRKRSNYAAMEDLSKMGVARCFLKVAAMAADMRMKGLGGVTRPPMPTEDSKQFANTQLAGSAKPGKFMNVAQPKNLTAPGPSIQQASTLPTG
jgi:hypothetical protein